MKKIYLLLSVLFMTFSSYGFEKLSSDQGINQIQQTNNDGDVESIDNNEFNETNTEIWAYDFFSKDNLNGLKFIQNGYNTLSMIKINRTSIIDEGILKAIDYHNQEMISGNYRNADTIIVDEQIVQQSRFLNHISLSAKYKKICIWWWWGKCRTYFNLLTGYSIRTLTESGKMIFSIAAYLGSSIVMAYNFFTSIDLNNVGKDKALNELAIYSTYLFNFFKDFEWQICVAVGTALLLFGGFGFLKFVMFLIDVATPPFYAIRHIMLSKRHFTLHYVAPIFYSHYSLQ